MPKTMKFRGGKETRLRLMLLTMLSATLLWMVDYGSPVHAAPPVTIDSRRSLVVTEVDILSRFPLKRVLDQLVVQSGVTGLTSLDLFHQWWDTQNPAAQRFGHEPHCTGFLNGFPFTCRPAPSEGGQAAPTVNPFVDPNHPDAYLPIGLFNRFDLAVADGSHCGEYRIVYAKRSGIEQPLQRNLLIFEAKLPNPLPHQGLEGCRRIVDFWADLSKEDAIDRRAQDLERFYFQGQGNIAPVVHISHYGDNPNSEGQVRTNQFFNAPAFAWSLREFKLIRTCSGGRCSAMRFIPVTDKVNPFGELHNADRTDPTAVGYRNHFLTQIEVNPDETDEPLQGLAAATLDDIRFDIPNDADNTGQSQASGSVENDYVHHFTSATQATFATAMQAKLNAIGSPLTPTAIILRAESQSCAGCHRLLNGTDIGGGLTWPPSLDFTHVTERQTEIIDGQTAFVISPALKNVFIPQRARIMEDYLNDKLKKPKKPKDTLSGHKTH